jgi:hypothetical protein
MKIAACLFSGLIVSTPAFAGEPAEFMGEPSCRVARLIVEPTETVVWKGGCEGGYASGAGVLERLRGGKVFDNAVARYEVTMVQGRISDVAVITYKNDDKYTGYVKDGQRDGKGFIAYANGDQFEGDFKNDLRNGNGTLLERDRSRYDGAWKDDQFDGIGTRQFALGGQYAGSWKAGRFDGHGMLTYAGSGHRLEAEFKNGMVPGKSAPAELPSARFAMKRERPPIGSHLLKESATGIIPFDKSYAELTAGQQAIVKRRYIALEDGDEPPYPARGLKPIFEWLEKWGERLAEAGSLRLNILIDKDGKPLSVTNIEAPSPKMAEFATSVMASQAYKPAVCRGEPCAMMFPLDIKFDVQH